MPRIALHPGKRADDGNIDPLRLAAPVLKHHVWTAIVTGCIRVLFDWCWVSCRILYELRELITETIMPRNDVPTNVAMQCVHSVNIPCAAARRGICWLFWAVLAQPG